MVYYIKYLLAPLGDEHAEAPAVLADGHDAVVCDLVAPGDVEMKEAGAALPDVAHRQVGDAGARAQVQVRQLVAVATQRLARPTPQRSHTAFSTGY